MQISLRTIIVNNTNRFVVVIDGLAEDGIGYGTKDLAYARMDYLWDRRTQSDKTMESLYSGRD